MTANRKRPTGWGILALSFLSVILPPAMYFGLVGRFDNVWQATGFSPSIIGFGLGLLLGPITWAVARRTLSAVRGADISAAVRARLRIGLYVAAVSTIGWAVFAIGFGVLLHLVLFGQRPS